MLGPLISKIKGCFHEFLSVLVVFYESLSFILNWLRILISKYTIKKIKIILKFTLDIFIFREDVKFILFLKGFKDKIRNIIFTFTQLNDQLLLFLRFSNNKLDFFFVHWYIYLK